MRAPQLHLTPSNVFLQALAMPQPSQRNLFGSGLFYEPSSDVPVPRSNQPIGLSDPPARSLQTPMTSISRRNPLRYPAPDVPEPHPITLRFHNERSHKFAACSWCGGICDRFDEMNGRQSGPCLRIFARPIQLEVLNCGRVEDFLCRCGICHQIACRTRSPSLPQERHLDDFMYKNLATALQVPITKLTSDDLLGRLGVLAQCYPDEKCLQWMQLNPSALYLKAPWIALRLFPEQYQRPMRLITAMDCSTCGKLNDVLSHLPQRRDRGIMQGAGADGLYQFYIGRVEDLVCRCRSSHFSCWLQ